MVITHLESLPKLPPLEDPEDGNCNSSPGGSPELLTEVTPLITGGGWVGGGGGGVLDPRNPYSAPHQEMMP